MNGRVSNRSESRRGFLVHGSSAVALTLLAGDREAFAQQSDPRPSDGAGAVPLGKSLYQDVVDYCQIGEHRTATAEDLETSRWLKQRLEDAGFEAKLKPFVVPQQYFPKTHRLTVDNNNFECFPLWWSATTGPHPIGAPLAPIATDAVNGSLAGKIALVIVPPDPYASTLPGRRIHRQINQAIAAGATGVVAVTQHQTGEIVGFNAMAGLDLWKVPVLTVGQKDQALLEAAAKRGATTSLLVDGEYRKNINALEVVGHLQRGPKRMVVSTPSSGWFQCAGERGPGIAIWLALANWAGHRDTNTSFTFVASPGHEMNGLGIRHFLNDLAPNPDEVVCWLHLGAGIATYDYEFAGFRGTRLDRSYRRRLMSNQQEFVPILRQEFQGIDGLVETFTERPVGELTAIADAGYRSWGLAGGSIFHHMRKDRPELITGPELLEPIAQATIRSLERIESQ